MNRQQRRQAAKAGPQPKPPATPEDAKRFIDEAFTDRISWTAARALLVRITNDAGWRYLDPELKVAIATFLERHPEPARRG
jgi:hypothetical protein